MIVVAIDGPAASGKSSVARRLAKRLGFAYINSGSMYRALTWEILRQGVDPACAASVKAAINRTKVVCGISDFGESFIHINSEIPDTALRESDVNSNVSLIAALPIVREFISHHLHTLAQGRRVVIEGRDIGSVVFPKTPYKFYLDASPEIRRKRRAAQGHSDEIEARDKMDSSRHTAPLKKMPNAHVVDTSHLSLEGVVDEIAEVLKSRGLMREGQ